MFIGWIWQGRAGLAVALDAIPHLDLAATTISSFSTSALDVEVRAVTRPSTSREMDLDKKYGPVEVARIGSPDPGYDKFRCLQFPPLAESQIFNYDQDDDERKGHCLAESWH